MLEARIVEDGAHGVAYCVSRYVILEELQTGAGGGDALGVGVLVGALREEHKGNTESERPECRSRSAVGDHGIAARQQHTLGDVSVNVHVVGLGSQTRRIVVTSDGDDEGDVLVTHCLDHRPEDVQVAVPHGPHRQVDDGGRVEPIEPVRRIDIRAFGGGRPKSLYRRNRCDLRRLQRRRTRVDVQVAEQASNRMWFQSSSPPVRSGCVAGRPQQR